MLIDTKSLLAKLMATENIIVEQRKIPTAMFNVKDRILTVPIFAQELSSQKYDLFIGHEVGHALWTPIDGIIQGHKENINSGVLNVVEDSRIERKIKNKYPGLRNSFIKAYGELYEENFFGTSGVDINEYNLIDRINLHCKVGVRIGIKFTDKERELLNAVESTETYDDVIEVSKRIISFMKQQKKEKKEERKKEKFENKQQSDSDNLSQDYSEEELDEEDSEDKEDKESKPLAHSDDDFEEDEDEAEDAENVVDHVDGAESDNGASDGNKDDDEEEVEQDASEEDEESDLEKSEDDSGEDDIRSHTDEAASENQQNYNSENAKEYVYANIPKVDIDGVVFNYKDLYAEYHKMEKMYEYYYTVNHKAFQKLRRETNKVVSYLAKEFELRKNADQLKRASISKTGELNMSKIFSYQFSEDIFKKISVVPGGKSHGLIMFLDWSGSMRDHLDNTVKQLLSLVMFCKKVNIPYEVYAFAASTSTHGYEPQSKLNDLQLSPYSLLNVLSSKMNAAEFNYAAAALVTISLDPRKTPPFMQLSSTPLNEAIIAAMEIVPEFQKRNKLQMVNTVFLTDGEGQVINTMWDQNFDGKTTMKYISHRHQYGKSPLIVRDIVTRHEQRINDIYDSNQMTSAFIKLLKARTGSNVIGFYVISGRQFNRNIYNFFPRGSDFEEIKSKFRKEKFSVLTNAGYDEYYILRSEGLDTEDDVEMQVKENASTRSLVSAFSKYAGGRVSNRVILNRFIGLIT